MDHQGHGLALNHPIFHTPLEATFEWTEAERPAHYEGQTSPLYPTGVAETYRLAQFEVGKPEVANPTIVSHEGFFTDIPGLENLAEGNSAKDLGSLSLARQGRYFYWGYATDPERLTDGGEATLVNVLHYMAGKRDSLTVDYVCKTRRILFIYTRLGRETGYKRGVEEHFPNQLVAEWRDSYTPTFEGAAEWVERYLPYVFSGKGPEHADERYSCRFEVDRDALALGTPNSDRKSLEHWIALAMGRTPSTDARSADSGDEALDGDAARAAARRCLARYVHPSIAPSGDAPDWDAWYAAQQDRIAFVDSSGFWWLTDPTVLEREQRDESKRAGSTEASQRLR